MHKAVFTTDFQSVARNLPSAVRNFADISSLRGRLGSGLRGSWLLIGVGIVPLLFLERLEGRHRLLLGVGPKVRSVPNLHLHSTVLVKNEGRSGKNGAVSTMSHGCSLLLEGELLSWRELK